MLVQIMASLQASHHWVAGLGKFEPEGFAPTYHDSCSIILVIVMTIGQGSTGHGLLSRVAQKWILLEEACFKQSGRHTISESVKLQWWLQSRKPWPKELENIAPDMGRDEEMALRRLQAVSFFLEWWSIDGLIRYIEGTPKMDEEHTIVGRRV